MNEGSSVTGSKAVLSAEPPRRLKRKAIVMSSSSSEDDLRSGISDAVAETRVVTLTEPLRKSEHNVHRPNYDESDCGKEIEFE